MVYIVYWQVVVVVVVVVFTLKAVAIYSVLSNIRTGPTDANAFRGHRLTTQKGYTLWKKKKKKKDPSKSTHTRQLEKEKKKPQKK